MGYFPRRERKGFVRGGRVAARMFLCRTGSYWYSVRAGTIRMWHAIWIIAVLGCWAECAIGAGPAEAGTSKPDGVKAPPIAVQTHTLTNGLKILIHEDHSIPSVASYIFY